MAPDISVVIVSYKVPALLRACLASLQREAAGCSYEVIVVENASGDGTAELGARRVSRRPPDRPRREHRLRGRLEPRRARGRPASTCCCSTPTPSSSATRSARCCATRARIPRPVSSAGARCAPTASSTPARAGARRASGASSASRSGLSTVFRGSQLFNPESLAGWSRDSVRQVDIVTGCLCLAPRAVWEQLGGFDEAFFMYGEDADLADPRAQARLPPGDHARGGDRAPRRRVLALGRQARDEPALPRGAGAQALVAPARDDRRRAAAGRAPACARSVRRSRAARRRPGPPSGAGAGTGAAATP